MSLRHLWSQPDALEHFGRVAAQFGRIGQQQNRYFPARFAQLARRHEAVAAVVALAANHPHPFAVRIIFQDKIRHRGSGIFHQCE